MPPFSTKNEPIAASPLTNRSRKAKTGPGTTGMIAAISGVSSVCGQVSRILTDPVTLTGSPISISVGVTETSKNAVVMFFRNGSSAASPCANAEESGETTIEPSRASAAKDGPQRPAPPVRSAIRRPPGLRFGRLLGDDHPQTGFTLDADRLGRNSLGGETIRA